MSVVADYLRSGLDAKSITEAKYNDLSYKSFGTNLQKFFSASLETYHFYGQFYFF